MDGFMTHTVGQQLERVAAAFPDKEAIKYTDRPTAAPGGNSTRSATGWPRAFWPTG